MQESTPIEEQEMTINLYPNQISSKAEVFSSIPYMNKKLRKMAQEHPESVTIEKDTGNEIMALVDRSCIRISPKRIMSDEQREASAKRLAEARAKKVAEE